MLNSSSNSITSSTVSRESALRSLINEVSFEEFDQILFCNFFYFNRSEEKIVKNLYERDKATLIFQGDQRKWPVLDRISTRFSFPILEGDKPQATNFNLKLYSGFDTHAQVTIVREIINNFSC